MVGIMKFTTVHSSELFDGLVQDCSNSSALALDLLQFSTKPSICSDCDLPKWLGTGSQIPEMDTRVTCPIAQCEGPTLQVIRNLYWLHLCDNYEIFTWNNYTDSSWNW